MHLHVWMMHVFGGIRRLSTAGEGVEKICLKESILQYSYSSSGDKMTGLGV